MIGPLGSIASAGGFTYEVSPHDVRLTFELRNRPI